MKSNLNLTNWISYKRLYFTTFLKKYLGESRPLLVLFRHFHIPIRLQIQKMEMLCMGFEPGSSGW